jgi:hypothetical protein
MSTSVRPSAPSPNVVSSAPVAVTAMAEKLSPPPSTSLQPASTIRSPWRTDAVERSLLGNPIERLPFGGEKVLSKLPSPRLSRATPMSPAMSPLTTSLPSGWIAASDAESAPFGSSGSKSKPNRPPPNDVSTVPFSLKRTTAASLVSAPAGSSDPTTMSLPSACRTMARAMASEMSTVDPSPPNVVSVPASPNVSSSAPSVLNRTMQISGPVFPTTTTFPSGCTSTSCAWSLAPQL